MPLFLRQFQISGDLAHLYESNGFKYLSVIVDLFSRRVWVKPLKTKTPSEVQHAVQAVLDDGIVIQTFSSDRGGEYIGLKKFFKANNIRYAPKVGPSKAYMAEHFIYVIKKKLFMLMRSTGQTSWETLVYVICRNINNSACSEIGNIAPASVDMENEADVRLAREKMGFHFLDWKQQQSNAKAFDQTPQKLKVGDYVYKIRQKEAFQKSHDT